MLVATAKPAIPALCVAANKAPMPNLACQAAAKEPAAIPVLVNPSAARRAGAATGTATAPQEWLQPEESLFLYSCLLCNRKNHLQNYKSTVMLHVICHASLIKKLKSIKSYFKWEQHLLCV